MRTCLAVGTAVVAAVAVVIRAWHLADVPRLTDETAEALRAVSIVDHHVLPLSNVDPYIGPHVNYLVAGLFALLGPNPWLPRTVSLACGVLTVLAAERLARAIAQSNAEGHGAVPDSADSATGVWAARVGGLIAGVLVAVNPLHVVVNSHVAWSHATTPLFTTAGLWVLYLGVEQRRGWALAWAGLLFGLAVATHPTAAFVVAGAGGYALGRGRQLLRTRWPWVAVGLLVLVNAPLLVFNAITSGSSVTNGLSVMRDYGHGHEGAVGLASYARSLGRHGQLLEQMLAGPLDLRPPTLHAVADPLLLLYAGVSLVALLALPRRAWSLLVLPSVGLMCGMAYLNTTKYEPVTDGRYLAPLVPIVAAAVGCLASGLLRRARRLPLRVTVGVVALAFAAAPAVHAIDHERRLAEAEPGNVEMLAEAKRAAAAARPGEVIVVDLRINEVAIRSRGPGDESLRHRAIQYAFGLANVPYIMFPIRLEDDRPVLVNDEPGIGRLVVVSAETARGRTLGGLRARGLRAPDDGPFETPGSGAGFAVYRVDPPRDGGVRSARP